MPGLFQTLFAAPNSKYLSLTDFSDKIVQPGLNIVVAPFGSGKSTLMIDIASQLNQLGQKTTILSPFKTTNNMFNDSTSEDTSVLYFNKVVFSIKKEYDINTDFEEHVRQYVIKHFSNAIILADEIDFFWTQASATKITAFLKSYNKDSVTFHRPTKVYNIIFKELAKVATIVGFTGSTFNYDDIPVNVIEVNKQPTVILDNFITHDVSKLTTGKSRSKYRISVIQKHINDNKKVLMYVDKTHMTTAFIDYMISSNINFLIIAREDNSPMTRNANNDVSPAFTELGNIGRFIAVEKGESAYLNDGDNGNNHFDIYDVVIIMVSSSRANSLVRTDYGSGVAVIVFVDSIITAQAIQVMFRFRNMKASIDVIGDINDDFIYVASASYQWLEMSISGEIKHVVANTKGNSIGDNIDKSRKDKVIENNNLIISMYTDGAATQKQIAEEFGMSQANVSKVLKNAGIAKRKRVSNTNDNTEIQVKEVVEYVTKLDNEVVNIVIAVLSGLNKIDEYKNNKFVMTIINNILLIDNWTNENTIELIRILLSYRQQNNIKRR